MNLPPAFPFWNQLIPSLSGCDLVAALQPNRVFDASNAANEVALFESKHNAGIVKRHFEQTSGFLI